MLQFHKGKQIQKKNTRDQETENKQNLKNIFH